MDWRIKMGKVVKLTIEMVSTWAEWEKMIHVANQKILDKGFVVIDVLSN